MLEGKFERIKAELYLIVPIICIILWALYALLYYILDSPLLSQADFRDRVNAAYIIFYDTENIYKREELFNTLPIQLIIFVPFIFIPIHIATYIFFTINVILAIISVIEFNKIISMMDLKEKLYRFIFLMIISNGFVVHRQFWLNNVKFIVGVILFFIIRRELQFRIENREKNLRYYWVNYGFFVLAIGIFPPFIYLLFIYLFQDIRFREIFKMKSVKIYGIILVWFAIQNFIIFIYPSLILDLFMLYNRFNTVWGPVVFFYLKDFELFPRKSKDLIVTIMSIVMGVITLLLIYIKKLQIEEKFAYFCFIGLFLFMYAWRVLLILLPFSLLIFIKFINKKEKLLDFMKSNKIIIVGLIGIVGISFMPEFNFTFYKYAPTLATYPYHILVSLRWIFFISLIGISGLILHLRYQHYVKSEIEMP
jgi:hypothetical protein